MRRLLLTSLLTAFNGVAGIATSRAEPPAPAPPAGAIPLPLQPPPIVQDPTTATTVESETDDPDSLPTKSRTKAEEETDPNLFIVPGAPTSTPPIISHEPIDASLSLFPAETWGQPAGIEMPLPPFTEALAASPAPPTVPPTALARTDLPSFFSGPRPASFADPFLIIPAAAHERLTKLVQEGLNVPGEFHTTVIILGPEDTIPPGLAPADVLSHWHPTDGLLLLLFHGQPERTQAFFSADVLENYRDTDLRRILDTTVKEASILAEPIPQSERFLYMTASRLHQLHRQGRVPTSPESLTSSKIPFRPIAYGLGLGLLAAATAIGATSYYRRRLAARAAAARPIYFPEPEPLPRLGGPHCGGCTVTIHFGSIQ